MIKNTTIIAIASLIFVSCGTSSKTTSSSQSTKKGTISKTENSKTDASALKKTNSVNLKHISVADSKRAPMETKEHTMQKTK